MRARCLAHALRAHCLDTTGTIASTNTSTNALARTVLLMHALRAHCHAHALRAHVLPVHALRPRARSPCTPRARTALPMHALRAPFLAHALCACPRSRARAALHARWPAWVWLSTKAR